MRYIHNNPVKANMAATPRYTWSSYSAHLSGFQKTPNIDTGFVLKMFSEKETEESFIEYKEELVQEKLLTNEAMVRDYIDS